MKKAVIYVRVNTQDNVTEGAHMAQEAALRDHAAQHGWGVVAVYRDLVVSGLAAAPGRRRAVEARRSPGA